MWGGFGGREDRPQQVKSAWHLAAEFMSNFTLTVGLISITSPDLFYLLSGQATLLFRLLFSTVIQHYHSALVFCGNEPALNFTGPYTLTSAHLNAALHYATITLTSTSHRMLTGMAYISRRLSYCLCSLYEGMCHAGS